jgi:GT2 family glycosyltransferase
MGGKLLEGIMVEDEVTIIIKTFERPQMLAHAIQSIRAFYPSIHIIVADDSQKPKIRNDVEYHVLPFDVGVSAGRNFAIDKVKTKYFVTVDDDLKFTKKTKLETFLDIIKDNGMDLLCGAVTKSLPNECANFEIEDGILTVVPLGRPLFKKFRYCDYGVQFFIADTEKFKRFGGWDEELKTRGEHIELFLRAKRDKLKVAFTPKVVISHERGLQGSAKYKQFRIRDHLPIGMKKHGIKKIINYNGKEKNFV